MNVATGQVADRYLSLDQGMVIAAIANELTGNDGSSGYFGHDASSRRSRPLMAIEEFGAGRVSALTLVLSRRGRRSAIRG